MSKLSVSQRSILKSARAAFAQAVQSGETQSFPHRKLSATGKEQLTCSIPKAVIAALQGKEFVTVPGSATAKQLFEMAVLEAAAPEAAKELKQAGLPATGAVSAITDSWFPKDDGEFKTHPIQRECALGQDGNRPTRYFWEENPTQTGGVRCAPRPMGTGSRAGNSQMDKLTKDLAAIEAMAEGPVKALFIEKAKLDLQLLQLTTLAAPKAE